MIKLELFPQYKKRKNCAEDRREIVEVRRAAGADEFDRAHEEDLAEKRGEDRNVDEDEKSLPRRPDRCAGGVFDGEQGQRGHKRHDADEREESPSGTRRLVAQRQRIDCVDRRRDELQHVADVEPGLRQRQRMSLRRNENDAKYGDGESRPAHDADGRAPRDPCAEDDEHRRHALKDREIEPARVVGCEEDERVGRGQRRAHEGDPAPVGQQRAPFGAHVPRQEHVKQHAGDGPAAGDDDHGRNLAHAKARRRHVAAPEQRRQQQKQPRRG